MACPARLVLRPAAAKAPPVYLSPMARRPAGRKRWALYPPGRVPPGVQVHIDADGHPSFQAGPALSGSRAQHPGRTTAQQAAAQPHTTFPGCGCVLSRLWAPCPQARPTVPAAQASRPVPAGPHRTGASGSACAGAPCRHAMHSAPSSARPSCRVPAPQAPTSLQWYLDILPQLPPGQRPLEVVQQAGDTIFVPAGGCAPPASRVAGRLIPPRALLCRASCVVPRCAPARRGSAPCLRVRPLPNRLRRLQHQPTTAITHTPTSPPQPPPPRLVALRAEPGPHSGCHPQLCEPRQPGGRGAVAGAGRRWGLVVPGKGTAALLGAGGAKGQEARLLAGRGGWCPARGLACRLRSLGAAFPAAASRGYPRW